MTRPSYSTLISRALKLRCPRCGQAPMFDGLFTMHEHCTACKHHFEREPGYFLGSIYVNYGITSILITIAFVVLRFGFDYPNGRVLAGLAIFCIAFPTFFFRYARALWVALDCYWDSSLYDRPVES